MLAQHARRVVETRQGHAAEAFGREIAGQVVNIGFGQPLPVLQTGVQREGDEVRPLRKAVSFQRADDLFHRDVLPSVGNERLRLQDEPGGGAGRHRLEVLVERGQVLAVGQHDPRDVPGPGACHVYVGSLVNLVVIDHQFVVSRQPDVHIRAVNADRVGLGERGEGVLGRSGSGPVAAVGDYFGLCVQGSSGRQQGDGEQNLSDHIVRFSGCALVKRNCRKDREKSRTGNRLSVNCRTCGRSFRTFRGFEPERCRFWRKNSEKPGFFPIFV